MTSAGLGLSIDERRAEVQAAWRRAVTSELGPSEPALGFAVGPLLRELALSLRGDLPGLAEGSPGEAIARCAVLVRSGASPVRLAREVKHLRRALWDALRPHGHPAAPEERRAVDEWLDDALAGALERVERARARTQARLAAPVIVPPRAAPAVPPAAEEDLPFADAELVEDAPGAAGLAAGTAGAR
ncbi:hypothetical protein [Anaeromyxobacter paludicola]|uniref:Uncharacterized protein n=1 Tax=Anaeromyxobacter paludicola TaxID=2918171 RepID=A0ABM7X5Q4_9BACT|nr:hypothetical protein [Anaeromyxobacter paludicola]BDG07147.1 hypothetical protein AMPC_02600 [Anaeromyxobacter paludicola]